MNPIGFVLPVASLGVGALLTRPRRGFFPSALHDSSLPDELNQTNAEAQFDNPEAVVPQVTIEEIHQDELEITDHPVENGTTISDHAFKRPERCVIRCGWSNSPSGPTSLVSQAVSLGATLVGPAVGLISAIAPTIQAAQSILTGNAVNQVRVIYDQLLGLQRSREPFDILTSKRSYKSMLFESLATTTDEKTENSMVITAVCKQVIIVTTQTIQVPINPQAQAAPEETTPTQDTGTLQLAPAPNFQPGPITDGPGRDFSEIER